MRPESYIQAAQAYLVASAKNRRAQSQDSDPPNPFLTISREAGARAHSLANRFVEIQNESKPSVPWTVFDDNLVQEVLKEHDLPEQLGKYMSEDRVAEINEMVEVMLGLHPHKDHLVGKMNATIMGLARMGHVVLVGRGSHLLTRSIPGGMHLRLVAQREYRLEHFARAHDIDESRAAERVVALDAGRKAYVKRHFGEDITNPLAYDLVINMGTQPLDDVAAMLDRKVEMMQGQFQ